MAIPVPSGVTNVTRVENATVTFNLNGYKETSVLTSNISVTNVPEGMEAELSTKTLTLKIIGTAAQISKLRFRFLYGGSFHGDRPERQHGGTGDGDD